MPIKKIGTLQIESEAITPHSLFWKIQKIIYFILIIFLLLTFLGLTGPGILDKKSIMNSEKTLKVTYDFFARKNAFHILQIEITKPNTENQIQLAVSESYIRNQHVKQITPSPTSTDLKNGKIIYNFAINDRVSVITFFLESQIAGLVQPIIGMNYDSSVQFKQFFYP